MKTDDQSFTKGTLEATLITRVVSAFMLFLIVLPTFSQELDQYLPKSGVIHGDVMAIGTSPEMESLAQKIQAAAATNPGWFAQYAAQHQGSGVLPYHENLGVSKEEYQRFLLLS